MMHIRLDAGQVLPLYRRVAACPDPLALFASLCDAGARPDTLLLESADAATGASERSLLLPRAALRIRCTAEHVEVVALTDNGRSLLPWLSEQLLVAGHGMERERDRLRVLPPAPAQGARTEHERLREPSVLDTLRVLALQMELVSRPSPLAHLVAGIFHYDLIERFEELPPAPEGGDTLYEFWLPEEVIIVDHHAAHTTVLTAVYGGPHADAAYHDATRAIERLTRAVQQAPAAPAPGPPPPPRTFDAAQVQTDTEDADFCARVTTLQEHIVAGDVFQIVPSRSFAMACPDPLAAYRALRASNPSPYLFFVHGGEGVLFGASPETCVRVSAPDRRIELRPIAGTTRRGRVGEGGLDADLDTRLEAELRTDTKELAEHMMLVDLARNDVARVSVPGTRQVDRLLTVERYSHVMHLVSVVSGELAPDLDALHAYAGCMNMGTLVGAPKIRAAEILRRTERTRRGPYGGAVGFLTWRGEMNTAIVIRAAQVREGVAHVRAGAGVVHDSVPEREAEETRRKAAAVLAAIAGAGES